MTDDLDTRGQVAAQAMHDAVAAVAVPSPDDGRGARRRRPLLLVLAAGVAVVVIAVAVVTRDDGDSTDVASIATGDVPRLVLDEIPPGLTPTGAADLPVAQDAGPATRWWVYGEAGADDPFGQRDLGVALFTGADGPRTQPEGARPVEVRGREGWLSVGPDPLGRRSVTLDLGDGAVAYVASVTLDDDELLDAAGRLGLDDGVPDGAESVGELDLLGSISAGLTGSIPLPLPRATGHVVGYQREDDLGQALVVATVAGGDDALLVARWAMGDTVQPVDVRGTTGWLGAPYGSQSSLLVWRETPTSLGVAMSGGMTAGDTIVALASLRPATAEEWAALSRAADPSSAPADALASVSGEEDDGTRYVAYVAADGALCLRVEASTSSESCAGPDSRPLVVQSARLDGGAVVIYGRTTLGTAGSVTITTDDGAGGSEAYYDGGTVFAIALDDGGEAVAVPAEVVVRDAAGIEMARESVPPPQRGADE